VVNTSKDTVLADRAGKVDTPVSRGIGLIGKKAARDWLDHPALQFGGLVLHAFYDRRRVR
jgi:hypothetical protein